MERTRILVICDDGGTDLMTALRDIWGGRTTGFQIMEELLPTAPDGDFSVILPLFFARSTPHIIILCLTNQAGQKIRAILEIIGGNGWEIPVMLALQTAAEADLSDLLTLGVEDFVLAPFRAEDLVPRLRRLHRPSSETGPPMNKTKLRLGLEQFVGESPLLHDAIRQIPKLARCDVSVFITGETGTGKEMFARAIHYLSPRASRAFIPVNCGAIPAELVENELFGHEPGAFTGATSATRGLIHDADGGTLLLDEIDSLPLSTQVKLLRFLQDQVYRPLGSRKMCQANLRVIAASNSDMVEAVRSGRFRADLFYRINVLPLALPPLRERKEDIAPLACHFAAKVARELRNPVKEFSPAALQKLACHDWPGNVRELENIIQRAVVMAEQAVIRAEDIVLPHTLKSSDEDSFKEMKARLILHFERAYLQRLLSRHEGNITRAAKAANKNRRAFWQLLRKHNLQIRPSACERQPARLDKMLLR